jgi:spore maturation protein CgeB
VRWVVAQPGPSFSVQDIYAGWVEALRDLGQHVVEFNLDERLAFYGSALKQVSENHFERFLTAEQSYELAINGLYSTLYQAWPDVLLVVSGFFIPPRLLDRCRRTRTRVVIVHTESPYEDERQLQLAQYADVNVIDDPTNLDRFCQVAPTWYMPKAYRPGIHHLGAVVPELECDLAFVGTGYPSRVEFLEQMDLQGLDVLLAGNWQTVEESSPLYPFLAHDPDQCLDNHKTADVYRSARVGLNLYRREAQRPELSAGYWLDRPDERDALAAKAREAIADRTFVNHAAHLLRLLDA